MRHVHSSVPLFCHTIIWFAILSLTGFLIGDFIWVETHFMCTLRRVHENDPQTHSCQDFSLHKSKISDHIDAMVGIKLSGWLYKNVLYIECDNSIIVYFYLHIKMCDILFENIYVYTFTK